MTWKLDHLVVSANSLAEGADWVENALGVPLQAGGEHALMGTHNRLLGLGVYYLEVIAINPDAPRSDRPRWFDLDNFSGPPRLTHWAASCVDLAAHVTEFPADCGEITDFERGDLRWRVALSASGRNPMGDAAPLMIEWLADARVPPRLNDQGVRVCALTVQGPLALGLGTAMGDFDGLVTFEVGDTKHLCAEFQTPNGIRAL